MRVGTTNFRLFGAIAWCLCLLCLLLPQMASAHVTGQTVLSGYTANHHPPLCTIDIDTVYSTQSAVDSPDQLAEVNWQAVTLPDVWTKRWPDFSGVVWYRLDWEADCSKSPNFEPLAILVKSMNMAAKIWSNNALLWSDPHLIEPISRSWNSPRFLALPESTFKPSGINHLYVRLTGNALTSPGLGVVEIGTIHDISFKYKLAAWNQRTIFYLNIIISVTLGLLCACIWFFRRQEAAYGWYVLASICWVAFISNTLVTETAPFSDTLSLTKYYIAFFVAYIYSFCIFTWRFLGKKHPRFEKIYLLLSVVLSASLWLTPEAFAKNTILIAFYGAIFTFIINSLFVSYQSFRTRQLELWLLGITLITCLILSMISTISIIQSLGNASVVLAYTALVFAIFLTIVLALRLTQSLQKIENFNEELNLKILEAEQALETTLTNRHQLTIKNNQLKERLNLAQELHDGLGSSLVRAMVEVSHAQENLNNKRTLSILSLLRNDLRQIIDSFSESHLQLPQNPIYWLAPLRNRFIQIFDDLGIKLQWEVDEKWCTPPSSILCLTLYRVAEEALTNVIKHSQASEVLFTCRVKDYGIELTISDNGVGFNTVDIERSGIGVGMQSMRERVRRLAGVLQIDSEPGKTTLTVRVPNANK
ncbi:MAG: ATP-binding protein [Alcaligenaceae bacterium]|nr:ATP-binding protein [Alcaligenaceae bacterium]